MAIVTTSPDFSYSLEGRIRCYFSVIRVFIKLVMPLTIYTTQIIIQFSTVNELHVDIFVYISVGVQQQNKKTTRIQKQTKRKLLLLKRYQTLSDSKYRLLTYKSRVAKSLCNCLHFDRLFFQTLHLTSFQLSTLFYLLLLYYFKVYIIIVWCQPVFSTRHVASKKS